MRNTQQSGLETAAKAALVQPSKNGVTPVHIAAREESETAQLMAVIDQLVAAIEGTSSDRLNDVVLQRRGNHDNTVLHEVARCLPAIAYMALIEKLSSEALNEAVVIRDRYGKTPLHIAAEFQSEAAFIALIEKVGPEALLIKDRNGETPLHLAAQHQSAAAFIALIEKLSSEALNEAVVIEDYYGETPLHIAAKFQSEAVFIALIKKLRPEALNKAFVMQDYFGKTPIYIAVRYQSETAFMALIEKLRPEALNKAFVMRGDYGETPLHVPARYQSAAAFIALIEKVGPEALLIKDNYGETPLHTALQEGKPSVVLAVIEKTDIKTLNKILLLVPSHFSSKQKRDYFLETIGVAQLLITNSKTLSSKDKSGLLKKLLGCVELRRGQYRITIPGTGGGRFNEILDHRIQIINGLVDENNSFGDGVELKDLEPNNPSAAAEETNQTQGTVNQAPDQDRTHRLFSISNPGSEESKEETRGSDNKGVVETKDEDYNTSVSPTPG
jgi:ankyrin repeat protein